MNWMWDAGDMFGGLGNIGAHALAQRQCAQSAYQQAPRPGAMTILDGLGQAQSVAGMMNAYANAYTPPPETLESWFERLERRVNGLLDRGEFMSELEHMRWTDELEGWRGKSEPSES